MYSLVQWPNVQHTLLCSAKQQNSTVVAVWYSMQSVQLGSSGRPHKSSVGHCRLLLLLGRARQKGGFHSDHDEEEDPDKYEPVWRIGNTALDPKSLDPK